VKGHLREHGPLRAHLERLYEISALLGAADSAEDAVPHVIAAVSAIIPLERAVFVLRSPAGMLARVWVPPGGEVDGGQAAMARARVNFAYLAGEAAGLPDAAAAGASRPRHGVTIPLVVARRPVFGLVQFDSVEPMDEPALLFINAVTNDLAAVLERDARLATTQVQREAQRSRVYEEAVQAVRARDDLLATVSHDLGNPLATISICVARLLDLRRSSDAGVDKRKAVEAIGRATDRMQRMIADLLDLARIDAGHLLVDPRAQPVLPIINEAVEMLKPLADDKGVELEVELPRGGAFGIVCDRGRVLQVLANIVGNAIKFTPAGGSVVVRVEPGGTQAIFTVTDTGPGIAPHDLPHLFDRFWQAASQAHLGTGLGLAIARAIVEGQGGRIAVESRVGTGTKFTFTLPMEGLALSAP